MENLKFITLPNPILRQKSKPVGKVDDQVLDLVDSMIRLLEEQKDPEGAGLSAVQIGILKRVCLVKIGDHFVPFINPEILKTSNDLVGFFEGCLSIPDFYGMVNRPSQLKLKYLTKQGKMSEKEFKGLAARILQHEIDHMDGTLFIDHVHTQKQKLYKLLGRDDEGHDKFAEVVLT